ncbi:MAG: ferredoxin-type protein NapG [Bacteroidota bacterium]|nr:ferredoxin-type protein NapG [Bacteroidota bacterium]
MGNDNDISSRRNALRKIVRGVGFIGLGGLMWGTYLEETKASELVLRPPGALDEKDFTRACIKCGTCVEACPYDTLKLATPGEGQAPGTPYMVPREIPCYMCPDIPCVPVCPSGALEPKNVTVKDPETGTSRLDVNKTRIGLAVLDKESCLAFWGIQCDACYRACPLIGEAITLEMKRNERTGKHAYLEPVVHADVCTGCGMCEHACITEKPAIFILPLELAMGKVGDHYIKGWDKKDEKRLKEIDIKDDQNDESSIEEYLNDLENLIDE